VRVAGCHWRVEIGVEEAKDKVGPDHGEVRNWHGRYRHITLVLVAHAMLVTMRAVGADMEATVQTKASLLGGSSLAALTRQHGLS
jgi:SRSO17 transposase